MVIWFVTKLVGNKAIMLSKQNAAMPTASVTSTRENAVSREIVSFMVDISAPILSCSRFAKRLHSNSMRLLYHESVAARAPYRRHFGRYCLYIEFERHIVGRT